MAKGKAFIWPEEVIDFMRNNYKGVSSKELSHRIYMNFGIYYPKESVALKRKKLGIVSGDSGHFQKGHKPHNKGKKGVCHPKCKETWFEKGHIPLNYKPVGSERINADGYIEVKTADPNKWELKHRFIWRMSGRELPKGTALIFLNGNKLDVRIENLKLVSRNELLVMNKNKLFYSEKELTETGNTIAKLIIATTKSR